MCHIAKCVRGSQESLGSFSSHLQERKFSPSREAFLESFLACNFNLARDNEMHFIGAFVVHTSRTIVSKSSSIPACRQKDTATAAEAGGVGLI